MLINVTCSYFPKNQVAEIKPFGNGHINDTYKLNVVEMPQSFILQRVNTNVFPDPQGIVESHLKIQKILNGQAGLITIAEIIPNTKGCFLTIDEKGNAWRLTGFIDDSYTVDIVDEDWQAYEAGLAYGWFAKVCSMLNVNDFKEPIKDFHRLSFRLKQLNEAINENRTGRLKSIEDLLNFYKQREGKLSLVEKMVDEGKIPLRVVHNDTKINNLLFRKQKAVAVIDLDTVGPGILYYDYGDALRTSANKANEDEKELNKVSFNINAFRHFTEGYFSQVKNLITEAEKELFYLAPILLTYIMGIRFITDYLNGDEYYKIAYKDHNLHRSLVQKTLIQSIEKQEEEMKSIIKENL